MKKIINIINIILILMIGSTLTFGQNNRADVDDKSLTLQSDTMATDTIIKDLYRHIKLLGGELITNKTIDIDSLVERINKPMTQKASGLAFMNHIRSGFISKEGVYRKSKETNNYSALFFYQIKADSLILLTMEKKRKNSSIVYIEIYNLTYDDTFELIRDSIYSTGVINVNKMIMRMVVKSADGSNSKAETLIRTRPTAQILRYIVKLNTLWLKRRK